MNSQDITITENRARKAVDDAITRVAIPQTKQMVEEATQNERIRTGVITKFYPYLDKAEVKLDNVNKKVLCKILHRYGGDMIDFYTPLANVAKKDKKTKEPYIKPRRLQHVCVLSINDKDSKENLILGYYTNEEIVEKNPAKPGNLKLVSVTDTNEYWIKFGKDGLQLKLPSRPTINVGGMLDNIDGEMEEVDFADSTDVYTKDEVYSKEEVYTKEEVDELIQKAVEEALNGE